MHTSLALFALFCTFSVLGSPVPKDDSITVEDVTFQLFTQANSNEGSRIVTGDGASLTAGGFNASLPTKILVHGWMDDMDGGVIQISKREFLKLEAMNVIGVDWSLCSRNVLYDEASVCARQVGEFIGELVVWLGEAAGVKPEQVHVIGHSLGCHVAAYTSLVVKVGHLTGLDPAAPLFTHSTTEDRLDASDADFVDVFHTSIKLVGIKEAIGHVDFYPNGGSEQPGCGGIFGGCAHSAAYYFYGHTISETTREDYMAYECQSSDDARNSTCTGEPQQIMGYGVNPELRGIFYANITEVPYSAL